MTSALLTAFLALMCSGLPVALAMAVASLLYVMISGNVPDFVVIHRMVSGILSRRRFMDTPKPEGGTSC